MNRRRLALVSLTVAVGLPLLAWMLGPPPGGATHWLDEKYTWLDLTYPEGGRHLTYAACPDYSGPPEWAQGIENWDAAMYALMEFDQVGCDLAQVKLRWESWKDECGGDIACTVHLFRPRGYWQELSEVDIYFDPQKYTDISPLFPDWKIVVSAHEWGHNLNLADHFDTNQCDVWLIMAQGNNDFFQPPCLTHPSAAEVDSVAQFYGYWGSADPDEDSLGLAGAQGIPYFSNDRENFMGTDPRDECADTSTANDEALDPWPPDFNDSGKVTVADVILFRQHYQPMGGPYALRYDLNTNGAITSADLVIFKKYYTGSGRDTCTVGSP